MSDIRKAIMARLGEFARPQAKAEMAASIRRGIDTNKGGQWINGTWDGGTWSAMVFSEPSEAYGIPEFPHISKLAINPKDKPGIGGVIVNYDRGWDIKPSTPELQKAYREIAQIATAEVNKAVKQGWYSRPGAKARFAFKVGDRVHAGFGVPGGAGVIGTITKIEDGYAYIQADASASDRYGPKTYKAPVARLTAPPKKAWESSRPGAKAEMAASEVPLDKPFTVRGQQFIVRKAHPDGYEIFPIRGGYSLGKVKTLNREAVIHAMEAHNRKAASHLLSLTNARPGAKATMGKLSGLTDATLKGEATRLLRLWHHTKSGESGLQPSTVRYRILELVEEMQSRNMADPKLDAILKTTSYSRPGAKAEMGRMLYSYEVDELEEFLDAYGVKDYDIITSIGQVKVPKSQVRKALDAISSLNREIRKEGIGGSVAVDVVPFSRPGAKATNALADACWEGYEAVGTKKQDGKTVPNCVPKATAAKPESQDIESEEVKAGLKLMEKADEKVSEKIRTLIKEGKPQDQAVAIALDMKRRGEL